MKVTRLKGGYRITLSNSEFEALKFMVDQGQSIALEEDQQEALSPAAKTAIRREPFAKAGAMLTVTDDRR
jgi:hypothetical protein